MLTKVLMAFMLVLPFVGTGVALADDTESAQCERYDHSPYQCDQQWGCKWDRNWEKCTYDNGGGGGGNRQCSSYDYDPYLCNQQPNCQYDQHYRKCREGNSGPRSCWEYSNNPRLCDQTRGCTYDRRQRACVDDFNPGPGPGRPQTTTFACQSDEYNYEHCSVYGQVISARLTSQLSNRSCIYGRNWGYDQRGVWVNDGCRAFFEVTYYPNH